MSIRKMSLSTQVSFLAMFSVLAFLSSLIVKATVSYGAIVYAITLLTGTLFVSRPFSATIISLIAGLLYSLQSHLFLLMLGTFLIRGLVLDIFFIPSGIYEKAALGRYNIPMITSAMVVSSFSAGLYQYFFLTLFLGKIVDFGAFIVSTIFLVGLISNAIAGYLVPKLIMPRLRGV